MSMRRFSKVLAVIKLGANDQIYSESGNVWPNVVDSVF